MAGWWRVGRGGGSPETPPSPPSGAADSGLALERAALAAYLVDVFPQMSDQGMSVEDCGLHWVRARLAVSGPGGARHLRPGGTVSGPSMAGLADCAFYAAVLAMIGKQPLAVTVTMSLTFLRKPEAGRDLLCDARISKLGRRLAMGDCVLTSDGRPEPVATATMVYALPER